MNHWWSHGVGSRRGLLVTLLVPAANDELLLLLVLAMSLGWLLPKCGVREGVRSVAWGRRVSTHRSGPGARGQAESIGGRRLALWWGEPWVVPRHIRLGHHVGPLVLLELMHGGHLVLGVELLALLQLLMS